MAQSPASPAAGGDTPLGFAYGLTAYFMWGFLPLYMKLLAHVPTLEILANRVIWSVPVALAILIWLGRTSELRAALRNPRMIGMALVTAMLVGSNWGLYVYAITSGQAMEAALGYYINPLFSVLLGRILLRERLSWLQWAAVGLAGMAVVVLTAQTGRVPLLAIAMMLTWGFYAYLKRSLPIGPNQGFTLEVLLLLPAGLIYVIWLALEGRMMFGHAGAGTTLLLIGSGLVTAIPLMIYANAAKLLRLSTIGIMQYIAPTMIFLSAVFFFGEPFGRAEAIAFPLIWGALVLYSLALIRQSRANT